MVLYLTPIDRSRLYVLGEILLIVELRNIGIELGTAPRILSEITETILYILIWTN